MKCKSLIFSVLVILGVGNAYAQQTFIKGKVVNRDTDEPVEGAFVRILNTNLGTVADKDGAFSLSVKEGSYTLYITAIGYADRQETATTGASDSERTIWLAEAPRQLDDIVVTAQKEEGDIQRVAYSINAFSSRKVNEYRIWNSKDITALTPNLYSANPGDNRNVTSIRGITSTSYDPAVATYIDGVNQFSLDTYIAPLFDIERIEVLRGPQGTLYGRNAMGGVINIITKRPTNATNGFAEASYGTHGQQRYALGFRTPLVKDKLFLGASGMYEGMDGFYTNTFNDSDFDKKHSTTGNYYLTWLINPAWSLTANVKHHAHRNNGAFTLNSSTEEAFADPFKLSQNAGTTLVDNTFNTSLNIQHTGNVNFTSLTTYQSNHRYYKTPIDGDFSPLDAVTIINNYGKDWNNVKVFTQEFKLSSPTVSSSPFKWTAGTYFYTQNNPVKQATHFGANGDMMGAEPGTGILTTTTGKNRGIAVYGQGTYAFSQRLDATVGVRYDYERRKQDLRGDYLIDPDMMFEIQPDTVATTSYNAISPKVGLTFHISDDQHLYGVYSRGFRTGGLTSFNGDPNQPPLYKYKPEYSNNIEVGLKNTFMDNRFRLNLALFYTTVRNIQVPILLVPEAQTITRNGGRLTSQGAEVEFSGTIWKGLEIDANVGLTDATYDKLELVTDGSINLKGNKQIFTPEFTAMLASQYNFDFRTKNHFKLYVRAEVVGIGDQYFNLANTIKQDAYFLANAKVGATFSNWEISLWSRNVADKKYIMYAYDFGATRLGDPANGGITVRKTF